MGGIAEEMQAEQGRRISDTVGQRPTAGGATSSDRPIVIVKADVEDGNVAVPAALARSDFQQSIRRSWLSGSFDGWKILTILARWTYCRDTMIRRLPSARSHLYGGLDGGDPVGERSRAARRYANLPDEAIRKYSSSFESIYDWYEAFHVSSRAFPDLAPPRPEPPLLRHRSSRGGGCGCGWSP